MLTFPRKPAIVAVIATLQDFDEIANLPGTPYDSPRPATSLGPKNHNVAKPK
jgi:hypothetical protein